MTPWIVVCQAPLSLGFSRQEYWSGLPFTSPGDLLEPGFESLNKTKRQRTGEFAPLLKLGIHLILPWDTGSLCCWAFEFGSGPLTSGSQAFGFRVELHSTGFPGAP